MGYVAKVAVLGLAQARDPLLAAWIEAHATFPCTMVDRIVPAATPETLQEIADQLRSVRHRLRTVPPVGD